jgi:uncharacterized peroxidase-related enzyme
VVQLATNWREADITERDRAMLAFAEKMTLDAASTTEADVQALRDVGFSDEHILDITVLAAYRNFNTRVADALGCELRGELLGEDRRIEAALTTGKPPAWST